MRSIVEIITPASSQDLTILATVKAELDISDTASDAILTTYIQQASSFIAGITGRNFGSEEVRETFFLGRTVTDTLKLARRPVTVIASLTENDVALVEATDYAVDLEKGLLYRLGNLAWTYSPSPSVVVEYTAGYALLGSLPIAIERAAVMLVKSYYFGNARDTGVRSESTEGLDSISYFDALGAEKIVREMFLGPYTELVVA